MTTCFHCNQAWGNSQPPELLWSVPEPLQPRDQCGWDCWYHRSLIFTPTHSKKVAFSLPIGSTLVFSGFDCYISCYPTLYFLRKVLSALISYVHSALSEAYTCLGPTFSSLGAGIESDSGWRVSPSWLFSNSWTFCSLSKIEKPL